MTLFGGLAIFLYGMEKMSNALKVVADERMQDILGRPTTNRFMAKQKRAMQNRDGLPDFAAYTLESDIRDNLKRIYCHAERVAKVETRVEDAAAWASDNARAVPADFYLTPEARS